MPEAKSIQCREHGGYFTIIPRRGRPPVKCMADNKCSEVNQATPEQVSKAAERAATAPRRSLAPERTASAATDQSQTKVKPRTTGNVCIPLATAAKERLEALGWTAAGKAWVEQPEEGGRHHATLTASRDEETLVITWCDGVVTMQNYSLWSDKPSRNGKPASKLDFDPTEMTNDELVYVLRGMQVTWWNSLAKSTETAIIGNTLSVECVYDNITPGSNKRIIKFVDKNGGGFRAFHDEALIKVG